MPVFCMVHIWHVPAPSATSSSVLLVLLLHLAPKVALSFFEEPAEPAKCVEDGPKDARFLEDSKRAFVPEELKAIDSKVGLESTGGASCQEEPQALWVLGPAAVGKAAVLTRLRDELKLKQAPVREFDSVIIDGDIIRRHHEGYLGLLAIGEKRKCVWENAWPNVRKVVHEVRAELLEQATSSKCRRNLIIPETCMQVRRCQKDMALLKAKGYTNDVVMIYGPKSEIKDRGHIIGERLGKVYHPKNFPSAFVSFTPIMALANGVCKLVSAMKAPPEITMSTPCRDQEKYNKTALPKVMLEMHKEALEKSGLEDEEYQEAVEKSDINNGANSLLRGSTSWICAVVLCIASSLIT